MRPRSVGSQIRCQRMGAVDVDGGRNYCQAGKIRQGESRIDLDWKVDRWSPSCLCVVVGTDFGEVR